MFWKRWSNDLYEEALQANQIHELDEAEKERNRLIHVHAFVKEAKLVAMFTPDVAELEKKDRHLVFICDDVMKGHRGHDLVRHSVYCGVAYTTEEFVVWKRCAGQESYPIPLRAKKRDHIRSGPVAKGTISSPLSRPARIKGELYALRTSEIISIDNHRLNGVSFKRKRVQVEQEVLKKYWVKDRDVFGQYNNMRLSKGSYYEWHSEWHEVWMYVGVEKIYEDQLDGGYNFRRVRIHEQDGRDPYYYFDRKELDDK